MIATTLATMLVLLANLLLGHSFSLNETPTNNALLPPQLQNAASKGLLAQPRPNVFVLGTVHIGSESAKEASLLINTVRPRTVVVEVSPSRLPLIRKRNNNNDDDDGNKEEGKEKRTKDDAAPSLKKDETSSQRFLTALGSFPVLAQKGYSSGGLSGLAFATTILWGSLLKRSLTADEELTSLPRTDEFAATIAAADAIGATVVPCDVEIDDLMKAVARNMATPGDWMTLGGNIAMESAGLQEGDPIRRRRDESMEEWAERRRNIDTARASKVHGEERAPCISRALVDERDARFAESCREALVEFGEEVGSAVAGGGGVEHDIVVCVVGLVHLDGVVERLKL